jgi:hypothetical protein
MVEENNICGDYIGKHGAVNERIHGNRLQLWRGQLELMQRSTPNTQHSTLHFQGNAKKPGTLRFSYFNVER